MTKEEFYSKALTFDEVGEQVDIFKEEKEEYQQEIERLKKELEIEKDISDGMLETIEKAIEYIDRRDIEWGSEEHNKLLSILKGSDKE